MMLKKLFLVCDSKPGAAGPRGSPALQQLKQISLYCSSLQQLSWQPESYPGWKKTDDREQGTTQKSTNTFITSLTGHLLTIFSSNTMYLIFPRVCRCGHLLGQSLATLTNATAFHLFVCNLAYYCSSTQF